LYAYNLIESRIDDVRVKSAFKINFSRLQKSKIEKKKIEIFVNKRKNESHFK